MLSEENRTINEGDTAEWTATLLDDTGAAVASADMTTLKMWLYVRNTNTIINARRAQDILNTNNVTMHATSGLLTWSIQEEDTPIVGNVEFGGKETHIAMIEAVWAGSTPGTKKHKIILDILSMVRVPTS